MKNLVHAQVASAYALTDGGVVGQRVHKTNSARSAIGHIARSLAVFAAMVVLLMLFQTYLLPAVGPGVDKLGQLVPIVLDSPYPDQMRHGASAAAAVPIMPLVLALALIFVLDCCPHVAAMLGYEMGTGLLRLMHLSRYLVAIVVPVAYYIAQGEALAIGNRTGPFVCCFVFFAIAPIVIKVVHRGRPLAFSESVELALLVAICPIGYVLVVLTVMLVTLALALGLVAGVAVIAITLLVCMAPLLRFMAAIIIWN